MCKQHRHSGPVDLIIELDISSSQIRHFGGRECRQHFEVLIAASFTPLKMPRAKPKAEVMTRLMGIGYIRLQI